LALGLNPGDQRRSARANVRRFDKRIPFFKGRQQRLGVLHDHPGKENYQAFFFSGLDSV
jgi:hypothetical protein